MCFLITVVVEFLVVVQTGVIDLQMGMEGGGGVWRWIMSDGRQKDMSTHSCGPTSPSKQIIPSFTQKVFLNDTPGAKKDGCHTNISRKKENSEEARAFYLSCKQRALHFNATPSPNPTPPPSFLCLCL